MSKEIILNKETSIGEFYGIAEEAMDRADQIGESLEGVELRTALVALSLTTVGLCGELIEDDNEWDQIIEKAHEIAQLKSEWTAKVCEGKPITGLLVQALTILDILKKTG